MLENILDIHKEDFINGSHRDFSNLYKIIEPNLKETANKVRFNLEKFIERYNSKNSVIISDRLKSEDSFIDKCLSLKENESFIKSIWTDEGLITIFDIIQDLIGFRLICLTHNDIENCVLFLSYEDIILVDDVELYSTFHKRSPFFNKKTILLINNVSHSREIKPKSKESGYEGVHFICNFDKNFDLEERDKNDIIFIIPFEIQIRTMTHHLWADLEHKLIYSRIKKTNAFNEEGNNIEAVSSSIESSVKEKISTFNLILQAADRIQNEILLESYGEKRVVDEKNGLADSIIVSEETAAIASLDIFFDLKATGLEQNICNKLGEINQNSQSDHFNFEESFEELLTLYKKYGFNPLSVNYKTDREWGQQRIFLLLISYCLVYCNRDGTTLEWYKQRALTGNSTSKTKPAIDIAINIYRKVLFHDKLLRMRNINSESNELRVLAGYFFDIVVPLRLSEAYFYKGFYREASTVLSDSLEGSEFIHYAKSNGNKLIKKAYRQLGKYYWYSYHKEWGIKTTDLNRSIRYFLKAIDHGEKDSFEDSSSYVYYVFSNYYKYCFKSQHYDYNHFIAKIIEMKGIFDNDTNIVPYSNITSLLLNMTEKNSYDKSGIQRELRNISIELQTNLKGKPEDVQKIDSNLLTEIQGNILKRLAF